MLLPPQQPLGLGVVEERRHRELLHAAAVRLAEPAEDLARIQQPGRVGVAGPVQLHERRVVHGLRDQVRAHRRQGRPPCHAHRQLGVDQVVDHVRGAEGDAGQTLGLGEIVRHRDDVGRDAEPGGQARLQRVGSLVGRADPDIDDPLRPRVGQQARHRRSRGPQLARDRIHRAVLYVVEVCGGMGAIHAERAVAPLVDLIHDDIFAHVFNGAEISRTGVMMESGPKGRP